jgi:hypothetical protein
MDITYLYGLLGAMLQASGCCGQVHIIHNPNFAPAARIFPLKYLWAIWTI